MKQLYRSLSVFLLIVALSVGCAIAQRDTTKLNQEVEVVKAYRPSISTANKVNLLPVIDQLKLGLPLRRLVQQMLADCHQKT